MSITFEHFLQRTEINTIFIVMQNNHMQIMGSKSYAEFTLKDNMASSPEVVRSFLNDMSKMVRLKAEEVHH